MPFRSSIAILVLVWGIAPQFAVADEPTDALEVTYTAVGETAAATLGNRSIDSMTIRGNVLLRAADGGLLLKTDMGRIEIIQPEQIQSTAEIDAATLSLSAMQIERRLMDELGRGFDCHHTAHYTIAFDGNINHAKRVGSLLEQLHRGFFTFWKNQNVEVTAPDAPMIVLVFRDRQSFDRYAATEIGRLADQLIGYYHIETNRMITYDVPNFERNVSTVIHEATHQLAYNCGLQNRLADNPMWTSEGLAMFFEAPDMRSPTRWRGIGQVNAVNLDRFRRYRNRRPADSLMQLIGRDDRLRDASLAIDAYGESWALTYFLIRTRRDDYYQYLQAISRGKPMAKLDPNQRIAQFESAFGPLADVDRAFMTYMQTAR